MLINPYFVRFNSCHLAILASILLLDCIELPALFLVFKFLFLNLFLFKLALLLDLFVAELESSLELDALWFEFNNDDDDVPFDPPGLVDEINK